MNKLLDALKEKNAGLASKIEDLKSAIPQILNRTGVNLPEYTDHSILHSNTVMEYCEYLIDDTNRLTEDELYILLCSCILHDIGMAIPDKLLKDYCKICTIPNSDNLGDKDKKDTIRANHHIFSAQFIENEWESLCIPTAEYAEAIALVAKGHRKIKFEEDASYKRPFTIGSGNKKVRIVYLSAILRMADEFDITSERTPELYRKLFYPANKNSQVEFNKHASIKYVKFDQPANSIVTIKGECTDRNLYNKLKQMVEKIQAELNYCQKTLSMCSLPPLKMRYIEEKFECIGFIPISIKFGVDNERIFETLIGKNLYNDKFVAIRECIQNCIDACKFKKQTEANYEPKIIVSLQNNELQISDNGIGMDKYVIENYFATIGKSFYIHDVVNSTQDFKSIGQFGIGVASYFLICDEFRIATRKNNEPLDFKVTNKFDEYFYFNPSCEPNNEGTNIIFYLTDDAVKKLSYDFISEQIDKTFRFCEIPIVLKKDDDETILSSEKLDGLSIKKTLENSIKPYYKEKLKLLLIHNVYLKNDLIEASCGFVFSSNNYPTDVSRFPVESDMRQWFVEGNNNYNIINLYHKGVFVKSITGTSSFTNIVGDVNIMNGINLKLDRNDFGLDIKINNFLSDLDIQLLEKLKNVLGSYPIDMNYLQTYEFILFMYISGIFINDGICQLTEQMKDILQFIHFDFKNLYSYNAIQNINNFCVFTNIDYNNISDDVKKIMAKQELSFICRIPNTIKLYMKFFFSLGYSIELGESKEYLCLKFNKNNKVPSLFRKEHIIHFENSDVILSQVDRTTVWNLNNDFIAWALKNDLESKDSDGIYTELMSYLKHYITQVSYAKDFGQNPTISLSKINAMLEDLNAEYKTDFKATKQWFPHWAQDGVVD